MAKNKEKLKKIAGELRNASKMHANQASKIEKMSKPFKLRSQGSSFKMMGASPIKQSKKIVKKVLTKAALPAFVAYDAITDKSDKTWYNKAATAAWNNTIGFGLDAVDAGVRLVTGKQTSDMKTTPWSTDGSIRTPWVGKTNREISEEKETYPVKWNSIFNSDQAPQKNTSKNKKSQTNVT